MEEYFDLDYTKDKLKECLEKGYEPELCIKIEGKEYMIIPLKDKISFQWIKNTEEFYFDTIEELFESVLVNNIILNRDWKKIEDIWYF